MEVLTLGQAQRGPCTALLHKGRDTPIPLRIPKILFLPPYYPMCMVEEFPGLN